MRDRLLGIALMFVSLWAFAGLAEVEYEIRSMPYGLGFPVFVLSLGVLGLGTFIGLAFTIGILVRKDAA